MSPATCQASGRFCRCMSCSLRQGCLGLPLRSRQPFCSPDGSNLRPTLYAGAVLSFFPETNKTCFSILLGLKYLSPFFSSQGRRRALAAARGRKPLQGPTEVGHVLQLLIVWEEETSDLKPGTRLFQNVCERPKKNILLSLI